MCYYYYYGPAEEEYIYHTEIYNCIVVGQLSGYSKYFCFVFPLVIVVVLLLCTEIKGDGECERDLYRGTKDRRKEIKIINCENFWSRRHRHRMSGYL